MGFGQPAKRKQRVKPGSRRSEGALPNLIVIGAMKCGTSALHSYLNVHPEISMSTPKELDFFTDERIVESEDCVFDVHDRRIEEIMRPNWSKGLDWYAAHFAPRSPVRGESSPSYTSPWYPGVAARMASILPEARLIFLVRDPVERSLSNYLHHRSLGSDPRELDEALGDMRSPYVARSRYARAIEPFLRHYPRSRLLVITQEEMQRRRRETMRAVYRYAGVDDSFWSPKLEHERYRREAGVRRLGPVRRLGGSRVTAAWRRLPDGARWWIERALPVGRAPDAPPVDPDLRSRLAQHFRDDVARLSALAGRSFPDWSVKADTVSR